MIRASVPKLNLDDAFEQKNDIARAVEEELEKAMTNYGFEIVQTLIVDIEPDTQVKRAMNEINAGTLTDSTPFIFPDVRFQAIPKNDHRFHYLLFWHLL